MRRLSVLLSLPIAGLVLSSSAAGTAIAAPREHPWSAYFPAKGVSCALEVARDGQVRETTHTTVVEKTSRKVVVQVRGSGRTTYQLVAGGRLHTAESHVSGGSYRTRATMVSTVPSPAALAHRHSGEQIMTMTMTVPQRVAHLLLSHGRSLKLIGRYRIAGLGIRGVRLADADGTTVNAVGQRAALRTFTVTNVKPKYRAKLKREVRPAFTMLQHSTWTAKGLGDVLLQQRDARGALWTARMIGCGDDVRTARPGAGAATRHFSGRLDAVPPAVVRALGRGLRS